MGFKLSCIKYQKLILAISSKRNSKLTGEFTSLHENQKQQDTTAPPRASATTEEERVLILQGGGSLGAYECGVCKSFANHGMEFDIIGGTSIGAVNAAILTAGKYPHHSLSDHDRKHRSQYSFTDKVKILEDFWLSIAEEEYFFNWANFNSSNYLIQLPDYSEEEARMIISSLRSLFFGNPKIFTPKWFEPDSNDYLWPYSWPYIYDISPLKQSLCSYVDFSLLQGSARSTKDFASVDHTKSGSSNNHNNKKSKVDDEEADRSASTPRLIVTATDIQNGESAIFDSHSVVIDASTIAGCAGYPFYGVSWTKSGGRYYWDGSLLRNTALVSIIKASPFNPKRVYVTNVFPKRQDKIPDNLAGSLHRARDILFEDKTSELHGSLLVDIADYLSLIDQMKQFLESDLLSNAIKNAKDEEPRKQLRQLDQKYKRVSAKRGGLIKSLIRVQRKEKVHYLYEDADFSKRRIKELIKQGEEDGEETLQKSGKA